MYITTELRLSREASYKTINLRKPIFLLNPIPEMPYYKTEIIAMKPTVIDGDLARLFA